MELTRSLLVLLQDFTPVFTTPTFTTFVQIVTGWVFSQRHRFITEIIFSGGNVGNGHWSRFHRFFSHAAWDIDAFSLVLAKLVVSVLAPDATFLWAVDDTLCRRRGLTPGPAHINLLENKAVSRTESWDIGVLRGRQVSLPVKNQGFFRALAVGHAGRTFRRVKSR